MRTTDFRKIWIGNSFSNLMAGGSKALFDFAVPAIVARALTRDEFSQWSLVLQIVAYVYIFGIGLQTAIAKFIAVPDDSTEIGHRNRSLNAAGALIFITTGLAIVFVFICVYAYPKIFPNFPIESINSFRWAVALIGLSACAQILALLPIGVFMGLHQNFAFAAPQVLVRILTIVALLIVCRNDGDFLEVSTIFALGSATVLPLIASAMFIAHPWTRPRNWAFPEMAKLSRISKYCGSLSVSMISMLMITSTSILIVGHYDFQMTGQFALAVTASTVIGGLLNSVLSPLIPLIARINKSSSDQLASLLEKTTLATVLLLTVMLVLFLGFGQKIVTFWVGADYASTAYPLILVLFVANVIRFALFPYTTFLLAISLHEKTIYSAIAEGISNVLASLILARYYGAIGVAYGTVIGGVVGMLIHFYVNFKKTPLLIPNGYRFVIRSIISPILGISPLLAGVGYFLYA